MITQNTTSIEFDSDVAYSLAAAIAFLGLQVTGSNGKTTAGESDTLAIDHTILKGCADLAMF